MGAIKGGREAEQGAARVPLHFGCGIGHTAPYQYDGCDDGCEDNDSFARDEIPNGPRRGEPGLRGLPV